MQPHAAHVLVIEDDPNNLMVIQDLLCIAGVTQVYSATNGAEGVRIAHAAERLDLILLDIQLPGEDGFMILKRLRADPRFDGCSIVALTANVLVDDQQRMRAAGFNGLIGKPISFDRFPADIAAILQGQGVWNPT